MCTETKIAELSSWPLSCENGINKVVKQKRTMYQRKVDVDMLNAVKNLLADVSSVSPSSES